MTRERKRPGWGQLIAGLILLFLGVVSIFERWEWFDWHNLHNFWPLVLVAIGAAISLTADGREERRKGVFLVLLGGWMLISTLELFGLTWGTSWPLIFIVIGLSKMVERGAPYPKALLMVAFGIWLQISVLGLWGLDFEHSWPIVIVVAGLYLMATAFGFDGRDRGNREETRDA